MAWGEKVMDRDSEAVGRAVDRLAPLYCESGPYPCEAKGLENIPDGPILLAGNHSGGVLIPDVWGLGYVWHRHFGVERAIHGLAHEMLFKIPMAGEPLARLGVLRATREIAIEALMEHGHSIAVMPGGDGDVFRPYADRFKVRFGGRKGYAKTALRAGVPVVPVGHSGAHETLIVLRSGRRIAKALHLHSLVRSDVFPISLSVPWGLTVGPIPNLPVPARFRYRFGRGIRIEEHPVPEPTQAQIDELDRRVQAELQTLLDHLRAETPSIRHRLRYGLRR